MSQPHLTTRPSWQALSKHAAQIGSTPLHQLFADDPRRGETLAVEAVGLYMNYAKQRVDAQTLRLLRELAEACQLPQKIEAMFGGQKINTTEDRAVLHVALRAPASEKILVDGHDVVPAVHDVINRMASFSEQVRSGAWKGHSGKPIRNVVSIGIGGSDLGPVMAYEADRKSVV